MDFQDSDNNDNNTDTMDNVDTSQTKHIFIPSSSPSPFSSESPLTSSDSELSPPVRHLDPAHLPSPRMLHVLKRGRAPLTVVNDEPDDEPWSSFIAHHPELRSGGSQNRMLPWEDTTPNLRDESTRQSYYVQIAGQQNQLENASRRGRYKRLCVYFIALGFSAVLTAVPSLYIANFLAGADTLLSVEIVVTHTLETLCTWGVSILLVFVISLLAYSWGRACRRRYRNRKASLEEAVMFARETMPDYGSRASRVNVSLLALFSRNTTRF